jgi:hypothetical protein
MNVLTDHLFGQDAIDHRCEMLEAIHPRQDQPTDAIIGFWRPVPCVGQAAFDQRVNGSSTKLSHSTKRRNEIAAIWVNLQY